MKPNAKTIKGNNESVWCRRSNRRNLCLGNDVEMLRIRNNEAFGRFL